MERVNLLPDEARTGLVERVIQYVNRFFPRVLGSAVAAILILGFVIWTGQALSLHRRTKRAMTLRDQLQTLRIETENLISFSKQLDGVETELGNQKQLLAWKLKYLQAVRNQPRVWATILKDLRRNIPTGVWLTGLEAGSKEQSIRVRGGASNENLVTQFMSSLKNSPYFTDVTFNFTEKDAIGKVKIVNFEISCKVS